LKIALKQATGNALAIAVQETCRKFMI